MDNDIIRKHEVLSLVYTRDYSFYRNGNFCKGTSHIILGAKVDARAVTLKKVHWFFSHGCNPEFAAF